MRRAATLWTILWTAILIAAVTATPATAITLPPGFSDGLVATLGSPTAIAFTPDGRMLATTQPGEVRVYQNTTLLGTAINLTTTTCSNSERGLLGVAVDPLFTSNGFVYLYQTFKNGTTCPTSSATSPVNRVARYVMSGNTMTFDRVLITNIPSYAGNHNAGDLHFGKDGFLYVSVGDGGCDYLGNSGCAGANDAARDRNTLLGKILRITRDGGIPAGNPFTGAGTVRCNGGNGAAGTICQETFAWGLRNPFRFAFDPNAAGTVFHINDVGQNAWEEIDVGASGADYGWNIREGFCATGSTTNCGANPYTNPIFAYGRSDGCASITGGAFVPSALWPAPYSGAYLFSDYVCGKIFRLAPNGSGGWNRVDFATGLGGSSAVHLRFGPWNGTQALYYTTYANGGEIRRIMHTPQNNPPTAVLTANPTSGPVGTTVNFNGSGSSDPDGDALTYVWNFGDSSPVVETSTPTTSHPYNTQGSFTASLTVRDARGASSSPDTEVINIGNSPPSATIVSPAAGSTFYVGQTITLDGAATDPDEGALPSNRMSWTVLRHHSTHTHPWFGPATGDNLTFQAPAPEDLAATTNSYIEVILTATDSLGASTTVSRNVMPQTVAIKFATTPKGRKVRVNGATLTGPTTITSWRAWALNVDAIENANWRWVSWSDGGAKAHTIVTPASPATYRATFERRLV
jgi:glucose/arabinose dehydrogenase/PKD repeat protein